MFDDPTDDCFAARYYDCTEFASELSSMRQEIEDAAGIAYATKEIEWMEKSRLHEQTIDRRNEKECIYDTVLTWDGTESRHRKPCVGSKGRLVRFGRVVSHQASVVQSDPGYLH
jgi:hypothetical protein